MGNGKAFFFKIYLRPKIFANVIKEYTTHVINHPYQNKILSTVLATTVQYFGWIWQNQSSITFVTIQVFMDGDTLSGAVVGFGEYFGFWSLFSPILCVYFSYIELQLIFWTLQLSQPLIPQMFLLQKSTFLPSPFAIWIRFQQAIQFLE